MKINSFLPYMATPSNGLSPWLILTIYSIIALFPVVMILINSFKARKAIFGAPFAIPHLRDLQPDRL